MPENFERRIAAEILIIDDNPDNLRLLTSLLKTQGYEVRPVRDGHGALSSATISPPDVVILDIMMPAPNGYEICRRLKADARTRDIPVIFISALYNVEDKLKAFAAGGVDYITKPLQTEEVVARIETHLTNRRLQQQLEAQNIRLQQKIFEHEQAERSLQQRNQELMLLHRVSQLFNSTLEWNEVLKTVLSEMRQLLDVEATSFWLYVEETDKLVCQQAIGSGSQTIIGWELELGQGIVGQTAQTGEITIISDTRTHPNHYKQVDQKTGIEIRSIMNIPFHTTGSVMGVISLVHTTPHRFTQQDLRVVEPIATTAANAIEHARLYMMAQQEIIERKHAEAALLKAHNELTTTLADLRNTQTQLLQSERMAALGQLVSGIAHEINTPAGAIVSAIDEIERLAYKLPEEFSKAMLNLPSGLQEIYLYAFRHVLRSPKESLSTAERRRLAREIRDILAENGIHETHNICTQLAMIGFSPANINRFMSLFSQVGEFDIPHSLALMGMSQIHIKNIQKSIRQIAQLVDTLKQFSRVDQGELVETVLQDDIERILVLLHNRLQAVQVHKDYDDIPPMTCAASQLNQVWTQLIMNGIQAIQQKGNLTIRIKRDGDAQIFVEIEDNGPGIPEDIIPKIFDPYFTTKSRQDKNIGMGLTICQHIVEQHQGRIDVISAHPGQTCFRVTLPFSGNNAVT